MANDNTLGNVSFAGKGRKNKRANRANAPKNEAHRQAQYKWEDKQQKKVDVAEYNAEQRALRSPQQQLAKLDREGWVATKERARLAKQIKSGGDDLEKHIDEREARSPGFKDLVNSKVKPLSEKGKKAIKDANNAHNKMLEKANDSGIKG